MAYRRVFEFLGVLLLLTLSFDGHSKKTDREVLDAAVWEETVSNTTYTLEPIEVTEEKERLQFNTDWKLINKIIVYALISLLFCYLLYYFYKKASNLKSQDKKTANAFAFETVAEAEEHLLQADIDKMLAKQLSQKNFNGAFRLLFLQALKQLHYSNHIQWMREKTNGDYLRELQKFDGLPLFKILLRHYEKAWYGTAPITENQYLALQPIHSRLLQKTQAIHETH
ncbi:MAG: DUF4129 domain-containing protein [Schleiferiaceae bacterium]|nr:DUF4129 domain-containing protein [Schleiferiaceae bacterium]